MQITIDTNELSASDKAVLRALLGDAPAAPVKATPAPAAKPEPKVQTVKAPTTEAPKVIEPVEEPVVEDEEEDLISAPAAKPAAKGPTLEDCVKLATQLVSNGSAPAVKEALAEVNAKRVSEVTGVANIKKLHAALVAIEG